MCQEKDCTDLYEICMVRPEYGYLSLLKKCAKVRLYGLLKSVPYKHNLMLFYFSIYVHTKDCTNLGIRAVKPPVNDEPLASIFVLISYPRMCSLALRNGFSLAAQKSSLSLLLSQTMNQQPNNGCALKP